MSDPSWKWRGLSRQPGTNCCGCPVPSFECLNACNSGTTPTKLQMTISGLINGSVFYGGITWMCALADFNGTYLLPQVDSDFCSYTLCVTKTIGTYTLGVWIGTTNTQIQIQSGCSTSPSGSPAWACSPFTSAVIPSRDCKSFSFDSTVQGPVFCGNPASGNGCWQSAVVKVVVP